MSTADNGQVTLPGPFLFMLPSGMRLWIAALVAITPIHPAELGAYCKGFCENRYQDGTLLDGKCACIDYYPIERPELIRLPKHPRDPNPPKVYYGIDDLHYSTGDDSGG